jgi:tRNA(adenine34) deaminase
VGAVVVKDGVVISTGRNAPITTHDPTAHAEIVALRAAAKALGNYRLDGCELFVTLEPCAMCAGAMLHSRLRRVVYGASDPKTGAVGSVLNLFAQAELNHQTQVLGGVLAEECGALLQTFFRGKREALKATCSTLREDALRTPEICFADLTDYPWPAHYVSDLPSLDGLRLHYLDESGLATPELTYLCLHSPTSWSYMFREQIPKWLAQGHRVVAPDLIGFGKSDKPKKKDFHDLGWHRRVLSEFVQRLDLQHIVLVTTAWGSALDLPATAPEHYLRTELMDARQVAAGAGDDAPYPDRGHRAALRAFAA